VVWVSGNSHPSDEAARTVKKLLVFLLLVAAVLAGGAYWISTPRSVAMSEATFTYARVERGDLRDTVSGTGVVQPREVILVSSESPGVVVEVLGKVNDTVGEGDILLRLDARKPQLKLDEAADGIASARAAVLQAQALEAGAALALKYQKDIEEKGGFRSEREQAEVKLKAARAGVAVAQGKLRAAETLQREARLALDQAQVKVPVLPRSGRKPDQAAPRRLLILERKVEVGQMVGPAGGAPLFTLAEDLRRVEVHTEVAEGDIDRVALGLTATFTIASTAEPDRHFQGKVEQIRLMPASVKGAVYYNAVVGVANEKNALTNEWWLRPGMTAAVDIVLRRHTGVWTVPTAALGFQLDEAYQTDAARARLAQWQSRPDHRDWKPLWVWAAARGSPWPLFVRITNSKSAQTGIKDGDFNEVLEWEPGAEPRPGAAGPRVITNAPPAHAPGFFDQPANLKVS
jgi:HlyD family secretion protein